MKPLTPSPGGADDILNRMATDNLASQLSSSWGIGDDSIADQIYKQFAAQGQSFFQGSGDNCSFYPGSQLGYADNPYVTLVGGTTLTTTGPGGGYVSETVWHSGTNEGSGGGISTNYTIPVWQQGLNMSTNGGSTTMRNVPDVALTADNIWVISDNGVGGAFTGTSAAAPLWAAFTALINEQALENGETPVGFLNPALYTKSPKVPPMPQPSTISPSAITPTPSTPTSSTPSPATTSAPVGALPTAPTSSTSSLPQSAPSPS